MDWVNLTFLGALSFALGADAFAVALSLGLLKPNLIEKLKVSFSFGFFQFLFPLIGIGIGKLLTYGASISVSRWIGVAILIGVSAHMFYTGIFGEHLKKHSEYLEFGGLVLLATSVSIDALSVGLSLGVFKTMAISSSMVIGVVTFGLSFLGVEIGGRFSQRLGKGAEITGGIILLLVALRISLSY